MIFFAWVADGNTTFSATHHRVDEDIFSFEVRHQEGNPASLSLDIRNPRVGLLSPSRNQWAWLSWQKPDNSVVALFHGRLVGVPEDMGGEIVRLLFLGIAEDSDQQKADLAQSLRVLPYFDPVFIARDRIQDPDVVLEARPVLYHYGRTDKTVTVSNIVVGEDGDAEFGPDDWPIFEGTLSVRYKGQPLRLVDVEAEVDWMQRASGTIDIAQNLVKAFRAAGSTGGPITSFTGQGLEADWPLNGANIGGGWSVAATRLTLLSGNGVTPTYIEVGILPAHIDQPPDPAIILAGLAGSTVNPVNKARFYLWVFKSTFEVSYAAARDRSEKLSFTLAADVQDLISTEDEPKREKLSFQSSEVGEFVDDIDAEDDIFTGERRPIGSLTSRTYFNKNRGRQSLQFLILVARAKLLMAARAAEISLETSFAAAVSLSCRKGASIIDSRIPGGAATGKIVAYRFGLDGERGEMFGDLVVGSTIGREEAFTVEGGEPTIWEEGIVDPACQEYSDQDVELIPGVLGAIKYRNFNIPAADDGIDFSPAKMNAAANVQALTVLNGEAVQRNALAGNFSDIQAAVNALNEVHTRVELTLRPLTGGPFRAEFPVTVFPMVVPRQLDLEAS